MAVLRTLKDLFHHLLPDLYNAEQQLIEVLPVMVREAASSELKAAFAEHLEETKKQKERLYEIGDLLSIDLGGETCEAMQGLLEETKSLISMSAVNVVREAGLIADAQRVEHYEISAYGSAVTFARALNQLKSCGKIAGVTE